MTNGPITGGLASFWQQKNEASTFQVVESKTHDVFPIIYSLHKESVIPYRDALYDEDVFVLVKKGNNIFECKCVKREGKYTFTNEAHSFHLEIVTGKSPKIETLYQYATWLQTVMKEEWVESSFEHIMHIRRFVHVIFAQPQSEQEQKYNRKVLASWNFLISK